MMFEVICECGHTLQIEDRFAGQTGKCRHCGRSIEVPPVPPIFQAIGSSSWKSPKVLVSAGLGVIVGCVLGVPFGYEKARSDMRAVLRKSFEDTQTRMSGSGNSAQTIQPPTYVSPPGITFQQFSGVQEGMTYDQVVGIIGAPHEEGMFHQSSSFGTTQSYKWRGNPKGSGSVTFSDGYVSSKNWIQF